MEELSYLTGKDYSDWDVVTSNEEEKYIPVEISYGNLLTKVPKKGHGVLFAGLGVVGFVVVIGFKKRRKN